MENAEDKQLARLYDYTKFHIGIYLSFAAGIAALLGSEKLIVLLEPMIKDNRPGLYAALVFMMLAGMCGGVVASSTIECKTFQHFWREPQGPQTVPFLSFPGRYWAMLEHLFFWLSLLALGGTVALGFPQAHPHAKPAPVLPQVVCCCVQSASQVPCAAK